MEMTKKEEKKSEWYWEIGDKKTNKPNEVIAWLMVEKAKLEEENKKLKERVEELEKEKRRDGLLGQSTMEEAYNRIIELEEENKNLNIKVASLEGEIKGLNSVIEKIKEENQTLELWLDRKEKLNEKYRKEIEELKSTYVYDAKQVRDIC